MERLFEIRWEQCHRGLVVFAQGKGAGALRDFNVIKSHVVLNIRQIRATSVNRGASSFSPLGRSNPGVFILPTENNITIVINRKRPLE